MSWGGQDASETPEPLTAWQWLKVAFGSAPDPVPYADPPCIRTPEAG